MPTRPTNRLKAMYEIAQSDEATLDDLLDLICIKVAAMQRRRDETRNAEQQFVGYILNIYHQVAQRLRTAEALIQAFIDYAQTLGIQDPTLNRLVTEATNLLRGKVTKSPYEDSVDIRRQADRHTPTQL